MTGPNIKLKKRLLWVLAIFTLCTVGLVVRIAWIQIANGQEYQQKAFEQQTSNRTISPKRGTIYDRNMEPLAVSGSVETISCSPQVIKKQTKLDVDKIASDLAEILEMDKEKIKEKLTKSSRYELIKKKVDKEVGLKVRQWKKDNEIDGIYVDEDTKRFYPNGNLAAHVIGFTNIDNDGLDGVEKMMEKYLKGVPGKILSEVDASGVELSMGQEQYIQPQDGNDVVLTIDETIQYFAEKTLEKAIADNNVLNGATAIVMDPRNGEILALASKPDFDLNNPRAAPPGVDKTTWTGTSAKDVQYLQKTVWRNKAVVDTYEPGSTFKPITSAAGLEEGLITADTQVTDATIKVGGWSINCWKPNAHLHETFREGVYNSCNPVFVRLAQKMGIDKFYSYVKAFGFYKKTGIDLPGEASSIIHSNPTEINMCTASFGQRFQITPIQLIQAYGAIANGGELITPHVVKEVLDSSGNVIKRYEPNVVRRVISKQTSETLLDILRGVVDVGTGKNARVPGYKIGGKTGTSETIKNESLIATGKYDRYIASFAAIAPTDNPTLCVLVVLDYPDQFYHGGGMIVAPVVGKLIDEILTYQGVEKEYTEEDKKNLKKEVQVPDVKGKTLEEAIKMLKQNKLEYKIEGSNKDMKAVVEAQTPKSSALMIENSLVILYTYKPENEATVKVPDVKDKTVYEATQAFKSVGLNIRVNGTGTAVSQDKEAGKVVTKGTVVEVMFRNVVSD
ncbi:PASTA domain-containing protein [Ruminiclostridium herbifermentans]|uniref:PASTA domain-containing protein n=1 Tax=Ruminiclostridium herbifermentans TaxID=2488810 RepID=A0A4U7JFV8_9FIRM|nr:penicillin-binding transpeptidase domain-containing protein [Ruminiclostridium herbifermentans]QNU65718.1 PASTA domain-containing protein [Ruminiclostridium herbifermentans]